MGGKKALHMITFLLVIIGGLNWLLVGLFNTDVGAWLGGMQTTIAKIIYVLVGLSAIYLVITHKGDCKMCSGSSMS